MAFVTLNGIIVYALANSGERDDLEIGEGLSRAFDGSAQRSTRGYKRQWSLQTIPDVPASSQALVLLLQGRGHRWSFDTDLFSDQGLGPSSSTLATIVAGGYLGTNALQLGATTGAITFSGVAGFTRTGLTLLVQRKESGTFADYALTWNAAGTLTNVYRNGSAQAVTLPSWLSVTYPAGALTISNTGAAQLYDELVIWPFEAPVAWLTQVQSWRSTRVWSSGPTFALEGTMATATVQGKPGKSKMQIGMLNGTLYDNLESFPFDLWEV